jgi:hypothetical protein
VCNVKVVLSGLPSVVIERRDAAVHAAIDLALRATEEAVRRSVSRRRMKPLRGRNAATGGYFTMVNLVDDTSKGNAVSIREQRFILKSKGGSSSAKPL